MTVTTHTLPHARRLRPTLLCGVSATALLVASGASSVRAAPFRSLSQALTLAGHAAQASIAPAAGVAASQQAALGAQNLTRAARQFTSLSAALTAAANVSGGAGGGSPIVVDGYGAGRGLQAAPGAVSGNRLWQGALTPDDPANVGGLATTASGSSVTVTQTAPLARLTWQTFNVGARTNLTFNQSAGGALASSWVVINTVQDPNANGSEILGAIDAQGKVFVLNRNGIAFGAGSTVNVGSLVAATASIAASQFSADTAGVTSFNLYGAQVATTNAAGLTVSYKPTFVGGTSASITVAAGAGIEATAPVGNNGGGYVMLLGGNVANAGFIGTPQGQTVLAAGTGFTLRQGFSGSITTGNTTSTTLGSEVASTNTPYILGGYVTGTVVNSGIVVADQGDISMVGHALTQSGVLMSTTTVNTRGTIHFLTPDDGSDPTSSVTLAAGSLTEILPEDNGATELDSARQTNVADSAILNASPGRSVGNEVAGATNPQLNNHDILADQLGESRVEISTGGAVTIGAGALVQAPGGQIAVGGGSQVLVDAGATLDVSGSTSALLPASMNDLLVNVQPFQLRDSASNRTGGLKGTNVYVDERTLVEIASGAYANNIYTPGGLIEVGGYIGQVPHGIGELTATGGQVTLQAVQHVLANPTTGTSAGTLAGAVITQPGSTINLQGGTVTYAAGAINESYVQATDGTIYNINDAPGNLVYTGLYGGFVVDHTRWSVVDTFGNSLLTPSTVMDPSYTVGRDAGALTINAGTAVLQGAVLAGVTDGQYQTGPRPATVADPYLLAQTVVPQAASLLIGNYLTGVLQPIANAASVTFAATEGPGSSAVLAGEQTVAAGRVAAAPSVAPPTPAVLDNVVIDAPQVSADGFSSIVLSTRGSITVAAPVAVADGGSISLTGSNLSVGASLTARGGSITLTDQQFGIKLAPKTAIALAGGATLDARGVWTNVVADPGSAAGLGHANGGSVSILGADGVILAAGSRIDVSSGGGVLAGGQALSASGGSVTVVADFQPPPAGSGAVAQDPVVFDSVFLGYGSKGGGTLSLTAPVFNLGEPAGAAPLNAVTINLADAVFSSGFSKYAVDGTAAVNVLPGAQVTAVEPIYQVGAGLAVPTGGDPSSAYTVVLPQLFTPTRGTDALTQRPGASISLLSSTDPDHLGAGQASGGPVIIGVGASVSVDPGQSIALAGYGQVTVMGTLTAHSGTITIANTRYDVEPTDTPTFLVNAEFLSGVSVWLADGSLVDVSGLATVRTDVEDRRFGQAGAGGAIDLGGYDVTNAGQTTWAQVVVRPGATLDADGASATVDVVPGLAPGNFDVQPHPVTLAGAGGSISARSLSGISLDGVLSAHAGDASAAGGALTIRIDPILLGLYDNLPVTVYQPREVVVTQQQVQFQPDSLRPGITPAADTYGLARISEQQIAEGGFDDITLASTGGAIAFEGNVSLSAGRSITLNSGIIGTYDPNDAVLITAPLVAFIGYTEAADNGSVKLLPAPAPFRSYSTLTVQASLIDIADRVYFGGSQMVTNQARLQTGPIVYGVGAPSHPVMTAASGFDTIDLDSTGDIRFLGTTDPAPIISEIVSPGDITLRAAQLYPTSAAKARVVAGYNLGAAVDTTSAPLSHDGVLTVEGTSGAVPQAPYSVGGSLSLVATDIVQDGIVRAPEGVIELTDGGSIDYVKVFPSQLTLAPGSITSVSLDGQDIPFGGTVDGVSYLAPGGLAAGTFDPMVRLQAQSVDVEQGATVDLRGGGTLAGAGFVFGRGGTADVLTTPLLDITGGAAVANAAAQVAAIQPVDTNDPVYAILPGYQSAYAPAAGPGDAAYTATQAGERITVGTGVAGLAAGTYTLLPAYDALLPGAYRVELTSGTVASGSVLSNGNFTSIAPVTLGTANTAIVSPVASAALFTSGTDVRQLSQYDEESYNAFEAASATQFGAPRPFLPQDAKTLLLTYPSVIGKQAALSFAPDALLKAPAAGGYGATLEIDIQARGDALPNLDIVGPGDTVYSTSVVVQASTLSALDVPRLVLGGTLTADFSSPSVIDVTGDANLVLLTPHAVLTAGEVMITADVPGFITVAPGARISTIGAGPTAFDASSGYLFSNQYTTGQAYPVLDVSQGRITFVPNTDAASGALITVGDGSALLAGGSLDIVAPSSTLVSIGNATLGAKYASFSAAAVNIGSTADLAALAGQLPAGIAFTPGTLDTLLHGNPGLGTPAASELTLTASQEVNVIGNVQLNTGSTNLVLNTPAIYGVGASTDAASIATGSFTWNGVGTQATTTVGPNFINASALPGGQIATGLGHSAGSLLIQASGAITLGYDPQSQANDQVQLDRLIAGFSSVTLESATEITANNKSSLTVYGSQASYGQPGTGGNLSLLAPLITTDPAAVLKLTAGGALTLGTVPGLAPAATAGVASLGGELDLAAQSVAVATAVAVPSGQVNVTAADGITLMPTAHLDLAGRTIHLLDQTATSSGGSLTLESTTGGIAFQPGAVADVSATGNAAGSVTLRALNGDVNLDGTLLGSANAGQTTGSFSVVAGTLSTDTAAPASSVFDAINAALGAGGFTAIRSFEIGLLANGPGPGASTTPDIAIGATGGAALLAAHTVSVTADLGSIDVSGVIDASGSTPGSIALSAHGNVTLEAGALLDAHASVLSADSTGAPIDALNRAHVTLTAVTGSLLLDGGTVDVSSPDPTPQGVLVLNAPRVGTDDVAIDAAAPVSVVGAASIALYGWRSYVPLDAAGTIVQGTAKQDAPAGAVSLDVIDADNTAFMNAAGANASLAGRLAGLAGYGTAFHLRPGVEIDSDPKGPGNLTISGDLDFSSLRYSDVGYGSAVDPKVKGSGEAGSIVFRAANDLVVNGSVTDGFLAPPDEKHVNYLKADDGWSFFSPGASPLPDPLDADIILPSSITVVFSGRGMGRTVVHDVSLGVGTTFDESRPVSLNYNITVASANVAANTVIPFAAGVGEADDAGGYTGPIVVPSGGFVTTAAITLPSGTVYPAGTFLPGKTMIPSGSTLAAGSVLPVSVQLLPIGAAAGLVIPSGTLLSTFDDSTLTLSAKTSTLPVNAFLPANTVPIFDYQDGLETARLDYRPNIGSNQQPVQGYLYALAAMLPPGSQSWSLDLVAGANAGSADRNAVLPRSQLDAAAVSAAAAAPASNGLAGLLAPNTAYQDPGSLILDDQHYLSNSPNAPAVNTAPTPAFSVIRTGTGDLSLVAGGNIDQSSLYGIYTAGTNDPLPGGAKANNPYDSARQGYDGANLFPALGGNAAINAIVSTTYQAYYPNDGGDVLVSAGGSLNGDLYGGPTTGGVAVAQSDAVGNWLWRQGNPATGKPVSWWINFGTFVLARSPGDNDIVGQTPAQLEGFQGIGALGGGNVTVSAALDAGQMTDRSASAAGPSQSRGEGLVIAIGGTGRVVSTGGTLSTIFTGGGDLSLHVGGTLNPIDNLAYGLSDVGISSNTVDGSLIDLRGNIGVTAGAVGRLDTLFGQPSDAVSPDPRPADPTTPLYTASGGITVVPGDGSVTIDTMRDLALDGVGDAGRMTEQNLTQTSTAPETLRTTSQGGFAGFSLWSAHTAITLFSAGGNVSPVVTDQINGGTILNDAQSTIINDAATDGRLVYPSQLYVTAATGDIAYGDPMLTAQAVQPIVGAVEIMPSPLEQVSFLAGNSIQANGFNIDLSGANPLGLSTPLNPAATNNIGSATARTDVRVGAGTVQSPLALFALAPDTPTASYLTAQSAAQPALFYAATGDILNLTTGETETFAQGTETLPNWYIAAKPVRIIAARDIVNSGTRPDGVTGGLQQNQQSVMLGVTAASTISSSGDVFLNNSAQSVSVVSAGRDILSGFFYVGGPGLLEVDAGRNIQQIAYAPISGSSPVQLLDFGSIKSLGSLLAGAPISLTGGASVSVQAGLSTGADYADFAALYLNPANQANLALPITSAANAGKVQETYSAQLLAWLQANYGYTGTAADALAYFSTSVSAPSQDSFLRGIFYAELLASGQQYNDASSRFFGSYERGRQAIDTLLPGANGQHTPTSGTTSGVPQGYVGTITMASGTLTNGVAGLIDAGIATEHGGNVDLLDPGGQVVLGTSGGPAPGGGTGIITNGFGNIDVFSDGSVLLGQSRIFTNAGGNIQIWSAEGDINAGIGARTSVVYNPPVISYDATGGLVESPAVPTTGAGIATQQPLPNIPPGNIDLTAPEGTIDAGEAGVRSSGNINLAALHLANTAGIVAQGKTSGITAAPSVSAATAAAAGAAAGAATSAAQDTLHPRAQPQQEPSVIEVEVLSIAGGESDDEKRRKRHS